MVERADVPAVIPPQGGHAHEIRGEVIEINSVAGRSRHPSGRLVATVVLSAAKDLGARASRRIGAKRRQPVTSPSAVATGECGPEARAPGPSLRSGRQWVAPARSGDQYLKPS